MCHGGQKQPVKTRKVGRAAPRTPRGRGWVDGGGREEEEEEEGGTSGHMPLT